MNKEEKNFRKKLYQKSVEEIEKSQNSDSLVINFKRLKEIPPFGYLIKGIIEKKLIDFSINEIEEFPKEILLFKNLEKISLSDNKIQTIPEEISKLIKLKYLIMENNCVNDLKISNLTKLREISFPNNRIIDFSVHNTKNIQKLNLTMNYLKQFPDCVFNLKKLFYLNLNYNCIKYIPIRIIECKNIESFAFLGNFGIQFDHQVDSSYNLKINPKNLSLILNDANSYYNTCFFEIIQILNRQRFNNFGDIIIKIKK
jgi:Leucine-rich repeat (LRR) protein